MRIAHSPTWQSDAAQCRFVGPNGRCPERGLHEFHHVVPYADGGEATASNIQLRCRSHNGYEAALWNNRTTNRSSTSIRIARSGWLAGTRCSGDR
jgi:hypothetical protein